MTLPIQKKKTRARNHRVINKLNTSTEKSTKQIFFYLKYLTFLYNDYDTQPGDVFASIKGLKPQNIFHSPPILTVSDGGGAHSNWANWE